MSAAWEGESLAAALGLERVGTDDGASGESEPAEAVPQRLLVGPYREARDAAMDWWERAYVRAIAARNNGEMKRMAADASVTPSYMWKITKRR